MELAILGAGMVTPIGLRAPAAAAALRAGIRRFAESTFLDRRGKPLIASAVSLPRPARDMDWLVRLLSPALRECLALLGAVSPQRVPLLIAVAEPGRPGRPRGLDEALLPAIEAELGVRFHQDSALLPLGRAAGAKGLLVARELLERVPLCIVAGVDSLLQGRTLTALEEQARLKTSYHSNGLIPGEAGAAVLVGRSRREAPAALVCEGVGWGREAATVESTEPLRAQGLVHACRGALQEARVELGELSWRIADVNGEQYAFRETQLLIQRLLRSPKPRFPLWLLAEGLGDVGAAAVPCGLGVALASALRRYAPGERVLCHFGSDGGERAALVLHCRKEEG
jgi:3-oxoacyl-[acyl-carrier-protein] synthase-1